MEPNSLTAELKTQLEVRTRELAETRKALAEALEQQTATSEVLQVISSSPGELKPVFQAMLENATRLCEAKFGVLYQYRDGSYQPGALFGVPPEVAEFVEGRGAFQPSPGGALFQLAQGVREPVQGDISTESFQGQAVRLGGARSRIAVPMLKENELVGAIVIYRTEVRPFTDKQIELVQNFASQAVIAIENTRLLTELRQRTGDLSEALEQQTATSEVLGIISSSPGELEPVFHAMLEKAVSICAAKFGTLYLCEAGAFLMVATHNAPPRMLRRARDANNSDRIRTRHWGVPPARSRQSRSPTSGRRRHIPKGFDRSSKPPSSAAIERYSPSRCSRRTN
jgi:hypothetical protein